MKKWKKREQNKHVLPERHQASDVMVIYHTTLQLVQ